MRQLLIDIEVFSIRKFILTIIPKEFISSNGIYKLYFNDDVKKRVYIGSATQTNNHHSGKDRKGFYGRIYYHVYHLIHKEHHSPKLQNYVNKYGLGKLQFEVVEICDKAISKEREEFYIKQFNAVKIGFNCSHNGHTNGGYVSPETRKIISAKVSAKLKGRTPKNWSDIKGMRAKPVLELQNGVIIREYKSLTEMCHINTFSYKFFSQVLSGKAKLPQKYVCQNKIWRYK